MLDPMFRGPSRMPLPAFPLFVTGAMIIGIIGYLGLGKAFKAQPRTMTVYVPIAHGADGKSVMFDNGGRAVIFALHLKRADEHTGAVASIAPSVDSRDTAN